MFVLMSSYLVIVIVHVSATMHCRYF